ncbi:MAG: chorismate synthase [Deltaproteobacteria bacterium]|nr:chorismate synthase [Deltaproteobacteria bacterium]MBW2596057.1 chorismate synthase [Deltaproteobacteria bacterium]
MSGNTTGTIFKVTTWGESHGKAIGVVVDGCPPGIPLNEPDIQEKLNRRRPGLDTLSSPRKEEDKVEILSGTFEGKTTGTPISMIIKNRDVKSADYDQIKDIFRPGHGDITYSKKYGIRDYRGGGRASGRETAARVAAGAIAGKVIAREGIEIIAYTRGLGGIAAEQITLEDIDRNSILCPDMEAVEKMGNALEEARKSGDSLGGIVEILVRGCPPGLGEPVFDKIDADLAKALMSIGAVKGVEIGAGFEAAKMSGSKCNDPITPEGFATNNAGGILSGITNGDEIIIRVACKPISSIEKEQQTIDIHGKPATISIKGRHDVCVIPRIIPVCEAMVGIVLADHLLKQRAK